MERLRCKIFPLEETLYVFNSHHEFLSHYIRVAFSLIPHVQEENKYELQFESLIMRHTVWADHDIKYRQVWPIYIHVRMFIVIIVGFV
jgi:hypothetical protein